MNLYCTLHKASIQSKVFTIYDANPSQDLSSRRSCYIQQQPLCCHFLAEKFCSVGPLSIVRKSSYSYWLVIMLAAGVSRFQNTHTPTRRQTIKLQVMLQFDFPTSTRLKLLIVACPLRIVTSVLCLLYLTSSSCLNTAVCTCVENKKESKTLRNRLRRA